MQAKNQKLWLMGLLTLCIACKRTLPEQLTASSEDDGNRHRPSRSEADGQETNTDAFTSRPDAQSDRRTMLVAEVFEGKVVYYRKPVERVPLEYRTFRSDNGRRLDVPFLGINCGDFNGDSCSVVQMNGPMEEWSRREIPRGTLTWLPDTDLLGLPVSQGGRKAMSEEEEGHEVPKPRFVD